MIPIHDSEHYTVAVLFEPSKVMRGALDQDTEQTPHLFFLDPKKVPGTSRADSLQVAQMLENYLNREYSERKLLVNAGDNSQQIPDLHLCVKEPLVPQQPKSDSSSCQLFVLTYMEHILKFLAGTNEADNKTLMAENLFTEGWFDPAEALQLRVTITREITQAVTKWTSLGFPGLVTTNIEGLQLVRGSHRDVDFAGWKVLSKKTAETVTVLLPHECKCGQTTYFEVHVTGKLQELRVGMLTSNFLGTSERNGLGLGDDSWSLGANGLRYWSDSKMRTLNEGKLWGRNVIVGITCDFNTQTNTPQVFFTTDGYQRFQLDLPSAWYTGDDEIVDQNFTIYPAVSWKGKGEIKFALGGMDCKFHHVVPVEAISLLEHDKVLYE